MSYEDAIRWLDNLKNDIGNPHYERLWPYAQAIDEIMELLKEQENLKQKMWNELYEEEDKLEKKFVGTEDDAWFFIYRPWLQRGFEIAIKVIAEQGWR